MKRSFFFLFFSMIIIAGILSGCSKNVDPQTTEVSTNESAAHGNKACTMEAKICPDGSTVGREGPNCEFKKCPGGDPDYEAVIFFGTTPQELTKGACPSATEMPTDTGCMNIDNYFFFYPGFFPDVETANEKLLFKKCGSELSCTFYTKTCGLNQCFYDARSNTVYCTEKCEAPTKATCGNGICEENEYVPCPEGAQCIWAGSCPQDCEEEQKDFWCGSKHYQIEDAKCEVIDPQPGYTCIDTDKGAILVPLSEETDTRNCVNGGNNQ